MSLFSMRVRPRRLMESPVWRDLPSDILEEVLAFLPIASLYRFRTVCKEWNRLISDPGFQARHSRASSPDEYVLMTLRYKHSFHPLKGWEVLDVANAKSFRISDEFVDEYVLRVHATEDPKNISDERATLAADGGLFCVAYFYRGDCEILLVCNPVLKTVKELPKLASGRDNSFRGFLSKQPTVVMSTDRVSMEYEIFVISHVDHPNHPNALNIYESKTGEWRTAPVARERLSCCFDERIWCPVSTFIKNEFYKVTFKPGDGVDSEIVSLDKATGVVSDLDFDIPCDADELQLVVSEDRLFCVTVSDEPPSIEIFELILARKECIRFTEMPGDILEWVAEDSSLKKTIASTGCENSILIHSSGGRSAACNLSTESWHRFPEGRDLDEYRRRHPYHYHEQEFYASSYCLSLCAP